MFCILCGWKVDSCWLGRLQSQAIAKGIQRLCCRRIHRLEMYYRIMKRYIVKWWNVMWYDVMWIEMMQCNAVMQCNVTSWSITWRVYMS
jgi:hypothetical protein